MVSFSLSLSLSSLSLMVDYILLIVGAVDRTYYRTYYIGHRTE